jgi:hypothetical protein
MNVIMDTINLSVELNETADDKKAGVEYVDMSQPVDIEE